ncbi:MAG: SAM-dependent methyltransferase [Tannerellaceae bacterium]|jgi:precorrin-6B methylase 2|nr:SAM-dependent methyltransferase [Tannerellaceae bacterium]
MFYKRIRHIRGHGVHSPFVYNLITKVIEERCRYYSFDDIELIRKQLLFKKEGKLIRRKAISAKHGALLFRLTNYFHPQNIIQIGATTGLSTLYLTSYATGINCISLENRPEYASVSRWTYHKAAKTPVDVREGDYKHTLPQALLDIKRPDLVFFNLAREQTDSLWLFYQCAEYIHNDTFFVFAGIKSNARARNCWKQIAGHPKVTLAIDLYSTGIVFFNKKLHKRTYLLYF